MTTLVETMARADAEFCKRDFDALGRADKRRFLDRAAFMLEAARAATMTMAIAGKKKTLYPAQTWALMIDAALQEHFNLTRQSS